MPTPSTARVEVKDQEPGSLVPSSPPPSVDGAAAVALDPAGMQALLAGASPDQLAMLARYEEMLEASGTLPVSNTDGRYDDPDEEDEQTGSSARAPPSGPPPA